MALRLKTYRVAGGDQIVCEHSRGIPEKGDLVFQHTDKAGVTRSFRSVRYAEAFNKANPGVLS